ncbi:helix-turn-helix domain-containing protein [Mycolicibacterium austroafricanum]|uniref:helix-turn-helix domain-containing protein n=1 Tax=Mycolicibacterium austroafricanum TaxID=39687 RepID=UPI001CA3146B|nr:helix-turn-helix domain-containing protein [Mycolicibacterium austroafricanum]QZT61546.1 helix-turn-helix domain-containing protein [Mycolicibacterium austroafricanum]
MGAWKNATAGEPLRGVVGRPASSSVFDLRRWAADGRTGRYVEHFWSVAWDLRGQDPFDTAVITFPSMHITREWGGDGVRHGFPLPNTLVHGVVEHVFRITIRERGWVVGARFRPGGFTARFGGDASTMTGRIQPVDDSSDVFGGPVRVPDDIDAAAAEFDRLIAHGAEPDDTYPALAAVVDRIRDDSGIHRVEQVMSHSPWSVRTTQRVFRRYVGVPVKWVLCRYRLQNAALEIEADPTVDFADLAVRLGWYDQAHFINDFRAMLGSTPGEYAATHGRRL